MINPDLRQLRYFVAVAEELHFGRAAQRVGIAQPPLTQQIQKLEAAVGCQLLVRGRKTQLTDAGAVLLDQSRRLLEQVDRALDSTRRAGRGETGQLTVGVPPSVMLSSLPSAIRKYREQFPHVDFTLRELSTSAIDDALRRSEIDVGFLRETEPSGPIASEVVMREPLVLVLPEAHPLAHKGSVKLSAVRAEEFVLFPRHLGPAFYDALVGFCSAAGFFPNVVQEATQWQTVVSFVEAGVGISLAPGCIRKLQWKGVVYRPVPDAFTMVRACWRAESASPAISRFLAIAKAKLRKT
jgi:DNA-binding transcriptional LysR family regulator